MSFAGLSGFDANPPGGGPPFGNQGGGSGPPGGGVGGPLGGGGPPDVQGVADFFGGGGGAPGFGGEDYFGGGGFLHGGNFLTQAQQPSGPQLSLIPVKIAQVFRAWLQDPSSLQVSLFPSGPLLHLVKIVGIPDVPPRETVEAALQSARVQFMLDDFTGRMECEFTVGDELTEYRQNQILDTLCCGRLVAVFGSINLLGKSEPALRVHAIRQTHAAADLLYHESACQLTYLRLKYPAEDPEAVPSGAAYNQQQQQQQQQHQQQQQAVFGMAPANAHAGHAMMPFG